MQQTETAIVEGHHVNIRSILDYIRQNWPRGYKISYRYILLPAVVLFLLVLGSSFIRRPQLVTPREGAVISRTPLFEFRPVKNLFYKGFEVELKSGGREVQKYVYEDDGLVTVTTPETLPRQARVELIVEIKKGVGPLTIWSKTYTYRFKTGT